MDCSTRLITILLLLTLVQTACGENAELRSPTFFLCAENIEAAKFGRSRDGEPIVVVSLTADGAKQLDMFSRAHLGTLASVVHGSDVLVDAELQSVVSSGIVVSRSLTESDAAAIVERLARPASRPCGETLRSDAR
jgi:preprotein translocase subunit SecD